MVNSEKIPIKIVDHGVQSVDDSVNAISNKDNPIFTSNPEPIQETETSMKPKADNESKAVDNWMGSNGGAAPVKDMDTVVNPTQCNINGEASSGVNNNTVCGSKRKSVSLDKDTADNNAKHQKLDTNNSKDGIHETPSNNLSAPDMHVASLAENIVFGASHTDSAPCPN